MKTIDKVMQYTEHNILNKRSFKMSNGLSNGYLGKQSTKNGDLGEDIWMKILENWPDLSPEWLLIGKGEMITSPLEVQSIKKPSQDFSGDGLKERYILLLERTISSLEQKIKDLTPE